MLRKNNVNPSYAKNLNHPQSAKTQDKTPNNSATIDQESVSSTNSLQSHSSIEKGVLKLSPSSSLLSGKCKKILV